MADDIRLVIGVEQSGLLKAITNTESLEKKVKKLSDAYSRDAVSYGRYNKAIGNLATATKKSKKELLDYGKALRADEQATKQAALATKQFAQARKDAIAEDQRRTAEFKKGTLELDRMRKSVDKAYAADQKFTKYKRLLRAEVDKGNLSIKEAARLQLQYRKSVQASNVAVMAQTKASNRMGVVTQQAGYQVSDFIVQVQGGQSVFVAFGQQASQLVGILPLMTGAFGLSTAALVGLSAGLGIAIPLLTAIGAAFFRSGKSSKDSSEKVDKYAESLKKLRNELQQLTEDRLSATTKFDPAIRDASEKRNQLANEIAKKEIKLLTARGRTKKNLNDQLVILRANLKTETDSLTLLMSRLGKERDAAAKRKAANTDLQGQLDKLGKRANEWSRSMSKGYKEAQDATAVFKEQQRLQDQALYLQALELKYTKDSDQYRQAENRFERENLALKLEQAGVDDSHIQSLLLGNMALEAGLRLLRAQRDATLTMFEGSDAAQRMRKYAGRGTPTGKGEPSTKKDTAVKESDLEKLRAQLDLEDALLGKTEARQRVIQALGVTFVKDHPNIVANLEAQITANENLLRIEEERKRMNDLVTDSMEDGLMAMADGTKSVSDAFRDMAREIIAELYRILVVQQMVNAAKSFFGFPFADGGAFSGGSQIQAYADGGIVGSPTTFPMAGGKTGLMGEAGPEAIMPLKRGANGKLGVQMEGGGGDTINVVQNFSFQANGDDSVKKIIAQAAPQIANMTKKSLLDDRRRGGTTKAVFG
jgi:hypothetical protein